MKSQIEEIVALRRKVDEQAAEIRLLKEQLFSPPRQEARRAVGLMPQEFWMLMQVMGAYPNVATYERLTARTTGENPRQVVAVVMANLRKKMSAHGVHIRNERGIGFYLDTENKARLDALIAENAAE